VEGKIKRLPAHAILGKCRIKVWNITTENSPCGAAIISLQKIPVEKLLILD